jgi:hypothetical protein
MPRTISGLSNSRSDRTITGFGVVSPPIGLDEVERIAI